MDRSADGEIKTERWLIEKTQYIAFSLDKQTVGIETLQRGSARVQSLPGV